jgi:hypothetical protein
VLEQDVALAGAPDAGTGPVDDVRRGLEYLRRLARSGEAAR